MSIKEENLIYLNVWNSLNQTNFEQQDFCLSIFEIDREIANQYFTKSNNYKILHLERLTSEDRDFLNEINFSLEFLEINQVAELGKQEFDGQNIDLQKFDFAKGQRRRELTRITEKTKFQESMVNDGYIYAVCPTTGKILRSNRSFFGLFRSVFYRFVGQEVFYLIVGDVWSEKAALYFPSRELIVTLFLKDENLETTINSFKAFCVSCWKSIKYYLRRSDKPQKVAIVKNNHFAHHLWNQLTAVHKLQEEDCLQKIDKFLILANPIACIGEIFPEISTNKIEKVGLNELEEEILQSNYFVVNFGNCFIKEDLASRVQKACLQKCSDELLQNIEEAKNKYFPLVWFSIRLGSRTWVSQEKGIINIINKLRERFPKLAIVFDGFSIPSDSNQNQIRKYNTYISKEKALVQKVCSAIHPGIKVYDTVGSWMYESIAWAYAIDLYVAHYGTIQHKVGWTANKPGIVHTNREVLNVPLLSRAGSWERENCILPVYVSPQSVTDIDEKVHIHGEWQNEPKFTKNYECDWQEIYDKILSLLEIRSQNIFLENIYRT